MKDIERLVAALSADAAPVRPAPHPFRTSLRWIGAAAAYSAVLLAVTGPRPDLAAKLHEPWFLAELAALLLIFFSTAVSAALLAFPDLHQKRIAASAPVLALAAFLLVVLCSWRADSPPAPLPAHSLRCTLSIVAASLIPAVWAFRSMRGFASTHTRWAGCIALLWAFSIGALWLRLHEVNDSVIHLIWWHYLPMLGTGAAGLWLGRRLLKW